MQETSYEASQEFRGEPGQRCVNERRSIDLKDTEEMEFTDDGGDRRRGEILDEFHSFHFNSWVVEAPQLK